MSLVVAAWVGKFIITAPFMVFSVNYYLELKDAIIFLTIDFLFKSIRLKYIAWTSSNISRST